MTTNPTTPACSTRWTLLVPLLPSTLIGGGSRGRPDGGIPVCDVPPGTLTLSRPVPLSTTLDMAPTALGSPYPPIDRAHSVERHWIGRQPLVALIIQRIRAPRILPPL